MKRLALTIVLCLLTRVSVGAVDVAETKALAEQGNSLAQHNLGLMYGKGQGVPQDYVEAYAWESLAANSGHQTAAKNRANIADKLSPEALNRARRQETRLFLQIKRRKDQKR